MARKLIILIISAVVSTIPGALGRIASDLEQLEPSLQPFYQECKKTSDCPRDYCCNLGKITFQKNSFPFCINFHAFSDTFFSTGMMRYQMPHCELFGQLSDPCHPYADNYRKNFTLNFPGFEVPITEAYLVLCPCQKDLYCHKETATCSKNGHEGFT